MIAPAATDLQKTEALAWLAARAGTALPPSPPEARDIVAAVARLPVLTNRHVQARVAAEAPSAACRLIHSERERAIAPPLFTNGRPASFPERPRTEYSPALEVVDLEGGFLAQIGRMPAVFACDGSTLVADYSSPYAGLVQRYDVELGALLGMAQRIKGTAVVLCDDIHPLNFSHWILDELPRLAILGERRDVTVVTGEGDAGFKRDSLRLLGFSDRQVFSLADRAAVQADRLLVPREISALPHPAFKAAPWAVDFLRSRIGLPAAAQCGRPIEGEKLLVSRDDGEGRRIQNEAEFLRAVEPLGYRRVTLAGRRLAEQAALFAGATHVLGAHGAGLTNCVFCPRGARLLELLPHSYGTPAYYVLMAGMGNQYASYVARDVIAGTRWQTDDIRVDVEDFLRCCGKLL